MKCRVNTPSIPADGKAGTESGLCVGVQLGSPGRQAQHWSGRWCPLIRFCRAAEVIHQPHFLLSNSLTAALCCYGDFFFIEVLKAAKLLLVH